MSEIQEKILNLLTKINDKIDKILAMKETQSAPTISQTKNEGPIQAASVKIESTPTVKPSAVVEKQIEEEKKAKGEIRETPEGRRICPKCGGTDFNAVEDKTKPLHYMSGVPIYAKKYICKKCGFEAP